jgi:hypothetical protein
MAICVAGMHRSGTSLVANLLRQCGLHLGHAEDLMPPAADNPDGYWENVRFVQFNDGLLEHLGGNWHSPPTLPPGWQSWPLLGRFQEPGAELIRAVGTLEPWGWKDPRTSITLPFWRTLLPDLRAVICLRDPRQVALSLRRRGQFWPAFSMNLWLVYNRSALAALEPGRRVLTHFDTLCREPRSELRRLLDRLGLPVSDDLIEQALPTIKGHLRHDGPSEELARLEVRPDVFDFYDEMYAEAER